VDEGALALMEAKLTGGSAKFNVALPGGAVLEPKICVKTFKKVIHIVSEAVVHIAKKAHFSAFF
jgi:hypothetical protein